MLCFSGTITNPGDEDLSLDPGRRSAMSETNKQLARRWFEEVWNRKSEIAIDEILDPQGRVHGLPDAQSALVGPEEFKKFHRTFVGAFPDLRIQVEDVIAEGDRVAIRWTTTATHSGDHLGFPASGKSATLEGASFIVVRNGKIYEGWNQMEMQGLLQYLKGEV
jgi:steroid delta-isomerase-like uncharacterized protein